MALHRHHIHQTGQVTVVNVRTVETDNVTQLAQQGSSYTFDTKRHEHFHDIVTNTARSINVVDAKDTHEICTICFQDPLVFRSKPFFVVPNTFLGSSTHEDFLHVVDSTELKTREQRLFQPFQEHIIFLTRFYFVLERISRIVDTCIGVVGNIVHNSNTSHKIFSVIIRHFDAQIGSVFVGYFSDNFVHFDFLHKYQIRVKFDTKYPGAHSSNIVLCLLCEIVEILYPFSILDHNRVLDVRIVVDLCAFHNIVEYGKLQQTDNEFCNVAIAADCFL
mmetsp:Transcript_72412/g.109259  ORF Transcript_72412/g.109259 Transcript_72412/m.109259 type:complete len:276 (+) Transcript_72412:1225-2052(+)